MNAADADLLATARRALRIEADAVAALIERLDVAFVAACRVCHACSGRVVVTGIGKSGHVAGKIAATLASTGTPAFFLHAAEASHGDIGMITTEDVLLALSNSGETAEILALLPLLRRLGVPLIAMTGNPDSTLAREAAAAIDIRVPAEACPLNLAPTASTTAALAMGDALAVTLLRLRGFTADDFADRHPGGVLGRRLLLRVADVMRRDDAVPRVAAAMPLWAAVVEMSRKGLGMTAVVGADDRIAGIFTDGDLRRLFDRGGDVRTTSVAEVMTTAPRTIGARALAADAVPLMQRHSITALLVTDADDRLVGALNVHDLLRAGVM
jgi:arabinose-5-phosphate isomerase